MNSRYCSVKSNVVVIGAAALLSLISGSGLWAETAHRSFVAFRTQPIVQPDALTGLRQSLDRSSYIDVRSRQRGRTWQFASKKHALRQAVLTLRGRARSGRVTFLSFYEGKMDIQDGGLLLADASGAWFPFETFVDALQYSPQNRIDAVLALDGPSACSAAEIRDAARCVVERMDARLSILVRRSAPGEQADSFANWMQRAFVDDHQADADHDRQVTLRELIAYVEGVGNQGAEFAATASEPSLGVVLTRFGKPSTLDQLLADYGRQIAALVKRRGAQRLMLPDFVIKAESSAHPKDLGALSPYVGLQIRNKIRRSESELDIVDREALVEQLRRKNVTRTTLRSRLGELSGCGDDQLCAVFLGELKADLGGGGERAALTVGGELVFVKGGRVLENRSIRLNSQTADLVRDETAMTGQLRMSGDVLANQLNWKIVGLSERPELAPHPLSDGKFPVQVYLRVNGLKRDARFSHDNRHMIVDLNYGEEYTIVVENNTNHNLFLRLTVDGRNTLPDRVNGEGAYAPAQFVSLTKARCWVCNANGVYTFSGFYKSIQDDRVVKQANARYREFKVVDASSAAVDDNFREQLGVITAAFYLPVPINKSSMNSSPNFATGFGGEQTGTIKLYRGDQGPGALLGNAPVNIRYGFAERR